MGASQAELWARFAAAALAGRCAYASGEHGSYVDVDAVADAERCADMALEAWRKRFVRDPQMVADAAEALMRLALDAERMRRMIVEAGRSPTSYMHREGDSEIVLAAIRTLAEALGMDWEKIRAGGA